MKDLFIKESFYEMNIHEGFIYEGCIYEGFISLFLQFFIFRCGRWAPEVALELDSSGFIRFSDMAGCRVIFSENIMLFGHFWGPFSANGSKSLNKRQVL